MSIYKKLYDIPFYEGYKLTEDFKIIGKKGKALSLCDNGFGHKYANVFVNGPKLLYLHRAIALVHVEGYFDGAYVDHIDRNPTNNSINNLRWVTPTENIRNSNKKTIKSKIEIYKERIRRYKTEILLLRKYKHGHNEGNI